MKSASNRKPVIIDDPLDDAAAELISTHSRTKEFVAKHRAILLAYAKLQRSELEAEARLKELARERSVVGQTSVLISSDYLTVSVQGKQEAPTYDFEIVNRDWPKEIAMMVTRFEIDAKRVELAVKSELISPELMQSAMNPRVALTPTVIIKHGGESAKTKS
jgi:hypothetical protein